MLMDSLTIAGTTTSPEISFRPNEQTLEISGYSLPDNANDFYEPIMEWLNNYFVCLKENCPQPDEASPLTFKFKLIYISSSSAKIIKDIISLLNEMQEHKIPISVYWFYDAHDDDMREEGEELADMTEIDMHFVEMNM